MNALHYEGGDFGRWIAIYTKPKQERVAVENIERQGYEAYCPMIKRRVSHARKVQTVLRPFFPSYIFVKLDDQASQWSPLLSTKGVASIVRFGDRLGSVPRALVDQLKSYEADGLLRLAAAPKFASGEKVKVTDGPFKDLIAQVLSVSDNDRIWLLLDLMGQSVRVRHDAWSISR